VSLGVQRRSAVRGVRHAATARLCKRGPQEESMHAFNTVKGLSFFVVLAISGLGCAAATEDGASASSAEALTSCPPDVPDGLDVEEGNGVDFALNGIGVQIYACQATATGPNWVFQAPKADLFDDEGELMVTHFGGPTWRALDGSSVVAAKVAGVTTDPSAIQELLLKAVSHDGNGKMQKVTFVQRLHTTGGLAPKDGCDADHLGAIADVPYTAEYVFYKASTATCH
jgi:Protein of unknown function (DUF3455)